MVGRFINADNLVDNRGLNTQNLFQYCENNPIMYADYSGDLFGLLLLGGLVGAMLLLGGCAASPAPAPSTPSQQPRKLLQHHPCHRRPPVLLLLPLLH